MDDKEGMSFNVPNVGFCQYYVHRQMYRGDNIRAERERGVVGAVVVVVGCMNRIDGGSMMVAAAVPFAAGGCVVVEGVIEIGPTQHCTHIVPVD